MNKEIKTYWQTFRGGEDPIESLCYVAFSSEDEKGSVLVSNVHDPTLVRGESFWERMRLTPDEVQKLRSLTVDDRACWMVTDLGIGILSSAFVPCLGMYFYVHINEEPQAVRRLLYRRHMVTKYMRLSPPPLGGIKTHMHPMEEDEALYQRLCEILDYTEQYFKIHIPSDKFCALETVEHFLRYTVSLTRCRAELCYPLYDDGTRVSPKDLVLCTTPTAARAIIYYWTGLMDEISSGGTICCDLSPISAEDRRLRLVLRTLVSPDVFKMSHRHNQRRLDEMNGMIRKGETQGIQSTLTLNRVQSGACENDTLELKAVFCFKAPPAPTSTEELRAPLGFLYDFTNPDERDA